MGPGVLSTGGLSGGPALPPDHAMSLAVSNPSDRDPHLPCVFLCVFAAAVWTCSGHPVREHRKLREWSVRRERPSLCPLSLGPLEGEGRYLAILSVQDMVMSCSPSRMPSQVCTELGPRTGTVPSPDSIFVRRCPRNFLTMCLLLVTRR